MELVHPISPRQTCDDDYAWGGCNLHGPYLPDATPESISRDFLIYCILAHRAKSLPAGWNWASFLKAAVEYIPYAFEKSDAKERWGSENYFEGASGAGRSLRYTGMQIYRSKVDEPGDSREHVQASDEVERRVGIAGSGRWTKGVGNSLPRLDNKPSLRWY